MLGFLLLFLTIAVLMIGFTWAMRVFGLDDSLGSRVSEPVLREADLERLREALHALDGRLERLEDQQRFLERLIAERPRSASLPPGREDAGDHRSGA